MSKLAKEPAFFQKRLTSLDVFRGATIALMILVNDPGSWSHVYPPLLHAKWHGWTFTDLVFPFFLFIVGVSIAYALSTQKEQNPQWMPIYKKIFRRTLILFGLGLFLSGFPYFNLTELRIPGVLQRIALCYFFASAIFLHFKIRGQFLWTGGLLLLYWALMAWIPVPGHGTGSFARGANLSNYLDSILLGSHVWKSTAPWDPEGLLSTIPAISTTLLGVLTGHLLRSRLKPLEKTVYMLIAGNVLFFVGSVWHHWFPVNKMIWTSSYVVLTGGLAMITLGLSYFFIDVKGWRRGIKPFIVYGENAISVYVLAGIVARLGYLIRWETGSETITVQQWVYQNLFMTWLSPINASLAYAIFFIGLMYFFMWLLYRKNIFIKV